MGHNIDRRISVQVRVRENLYARVRVASPPWSGWARLRLRPPGPLLRGWGGGGEGGSGGEANIPPSMYAAKVQPHCPPAPPRLTQGSWAYTICAVPETSLILKGGRNGMLTKREVDKVGIDEVGS